jgi:hypothetical protein
MTKIEKFRQPTNVTTYPYIDDVVHVSVRVQVAVRKLLFYILTVVCLNYNKMLTLYL